MWLFTFLFHTKHGWLDKNPTSRSSKSLSTANFNHLQIQLLPFHSRGKSRYMVTILSVMGFRGSHTCSQWDKNFHFQNLNRQMTQNFLCILSIRVSILLHALPTRHLRFNISEDASRVDVHKGKRVLAMSFKQGSILVPYAQRYSYSSALCLQSVTCKSQI